MFCNDEVNIPVDLICKHRSCKFCIIKYIEALDQENKHLTKACCKKCDIFIAPIVYQSLVSQEIIRRLANSASKAKKLRIICDFCKESGDSSAEFRLKCRNCKCDYCCLCMEPHKEVCKSFELEENKPVIQIEKQIINPKLPAPVAKQNKRDKSDKNKNAPVSGEKKSTSQATK